MFTYQKSELEKTEKKFNHGQMELSNVVRKRNRIFDSLKNFTKKFWCTKNVKHFLVFSFKNSSVHWLAGFFIIKRIIDVVKELPLEY